jgi:HIRAN domain-containing protein
VSCTPPGGSSPSEAGNDARPEDRAAQGVPGRLRLWLERGESGYWLRDAATGDAVRWSDERLRVVKLAGSSYRLGELQDDAFAPGQRLALVPEPENEHDPNAVAVFDADRRLQAGYVPAEVAGDVRGDEQAISLWEFRDDEGRRIGLRVLIAPHDAWIQEPRG